MKNTPETQVPASIWPILLAAGLTLIMAGVVSNVVVSIVGALLLLFSLGGWVQESRMFSLQEVEIDDEDDVTHG